MLDALPQGYKLFRCHDRDGALCGCVAAHKRKPTPSTGGPEPQCRAHGAFAALGAAAMLSAVRARGYAGPVVTEWPLQLLPQQNLSRAAPARTGRIRKKSKVRNSATHSSVVDSMPDEQARRLNGTGTNGNGGQYKSGHNRKIDIALFSDHAKLALELNGKEHNVVWAQRNDGSKAAAARLSGFMVHAVDVCMLQKLDTWEEAAKTVVKKLKRKTSSK